MKRRRWFSESAGKQVNLGINLCDPRQILTADEQRGLDADLAALASQRRAAEANCRGLWLG